MRRVLVALLVMLAAVSFAVAFVNEDNRQRTEAERAAVVVGGAFTISNDPRLADPEVTYGALREAALATGANVFRTSAGYTSDGEPRIVLYALLTGETRLFDHLPLAGGHHLTPAETSSTDSYLSTARGDALGKVGTLRDFGADDLVEVRGLRAAFDVMPVAGNYDVEVPQGASVSPFLAALSHALEGRIDGATFSESDFHSDGRTYVGGFEDYAGLLIAVTLLIVMVTAILMAYRQLYEAKAFGIMKLHGYGLLSTWYRSTGRLVTTTLGVATAVALALSIAVPGTTPSFVISVLGALGTSMAVMVVVSLITCARIGRVRISDAVKNRKSTSGVFFLNTGIKTVVTILLVVTAAGLVVQYQNAAAERAKLGTWASANDFGIFYPSSVGNDLVDLWNGRTGPTVAEVYDLYPVLNSMGSVFVDSMSYEPQDLAQPMPPGTFRSIQVNPNYLRQFPVLDVTGVPVEIAETTTDWIVLVPETHRSDASEIAAYFQDQRTGEDAGVAGVERAMFDREVPSAVAEQDARIIWIADGQDVFSFNPLVDPTSGNMITDPIIQVMTTSNSVGFDRANMITGAVDTALKIRLADTDPGATAEDLLPTLEALRLDDNLTRLITMDEYVAEQLRDLQRGVRDVAIAAAAVAVGLLLLIAQNLTVVFEMFSRRIVVRRLHGTSFVAAYREFLLLFLAIWILQITGAAVANQSGVSPFATATSSGRVHIAVVLGVVAAVVIVELALSTALLMWIERRRLVNVLKEEF